MHFTFLTRVIDSCLAKTTGWRSLPKKWPGLLKGTSPTVRRKSLCIYCCFLHWGLALPSPVSFDWYISDLILLWVLTQHCLRKKWIWFRKHHSLIRLHIYKYWSTSITLSMYCMLFIYIFGLALAVASFNEGLLSIWHKNDGITKGLSLWLLQ